jgi:L-ascorbate metabolism protein UlaG (beta-lactamase superfamily)
MKSLFLALSAGLMFGLTGCGSAPSIQPTIAPTLKAVVMPESTPTVAPAPVSLTYEEEAQVELVSPGGVRVLIDVFDPTALSAPATEKDILLTTHTHSDHINSDFDASFKGQQLFVRAGDLKVADVTIRGIASAHNEGDTFAAQGGKNYIFIVDMGGLRIAHFGDIGQEALTADQLAALGKVDIAITQFDNSYSAMDVTNKKGFNLMDQLKPRLIIPTHTSLKAAQYAKAKWPCLYSDKPQVKISRENLTDETQLLFLGNMGLAYGKLTKAAQVKW